MIGVLVMAYGGPNGLDEVEPYLMDVRGGRLTAPEIIHEVRERYREIGGRSPILERTQGQATALEAALNSSGKTFKTFVGMRHWRPYIKDTLAEMATAGVTRAVGLVMAPHYSRMSVELYFEKLSKAQESIPAPLEVARIESWKTEGGLLAAWSDRIRAALEAFPLDLRSEVELVFTAHSLPQRILSWGDPYPEELQATFMALAETFHENPAHFAYQSAAMNPEPWLGPDAGDLMAARLDDGARHFVIVPIGFVTEHVEILYDIDIAFRARVEAAGGTLVRAAMPDTDPRMIAGLAERVRETAGSRGWL